MFFSISYSNVLVVMPVIPIMPSINTCMSLTTTTTNTITNANTVKVPEVNTTQLQALAEVCSTVTGAESITMPNIVMNSLVSPTKVITNDTIPNPITHNAIMPSIPVPVTSIGIPIMSMKSDDGTGLLGGSDCDLKTSDIFTTDETERIDTEDEKNSDSDSKKNSDEPMPVEEDTVIEMTNKTDGSLVETDVEVADAAEAVLNAHDTVKIDDSLVIEPTLNKSDDLNTTSEHLSATEPMECASVNSMASPKHTMATDIIMAESVSVNQIKTNIRIRPSFE